MRQQIINEEIKRSRRLREEIKISELERKYSPRYRSTGELPVTQITNPGFSLDPAQMPTLYEIDSAKIE